MALSSEQQGAVREKSRPAASRHLHRRAIRLRAAVSTGSASPLLALGGRTPILRGEGHGQVSTDSGRVTQIF